MTQPKTIDNLGIDVSTRYAQDQKLLDEKYIKEAKAIPAQAQIDVTIPSYPSEFDALFELSRRNSTWADFAAPSKYNEQKKRLFTHQIIPSLGSEDKRESQAQRILAKMQSSLARKQEEEKREQQKKQQQPKKEDEKEMQQREKEKKILIKLLDCIISLDKGMMEVSSRRLQYQKG